MSRALDVVTLTGEEYDDLMECKEMVTSLLAQLSAAKDRIAELTHNPPAKRAPKASA